MPTNSNRGLSPEFMDALKKEEGILNPILSRVQVDDTLMLAIRKEYINIYYRGGSLMKIKRGEKSNTYAVEFNDEYIKALSGHSKNNIDSLIKNNSTINTIEDSRAWVDEVPNLKMAIDLHLKGSKKAEREFQQVVVRENNTSPISNETEYFIVDIEYAKGNARFDMVAIKWPATARKGGKGCQLALIEMKYGVDTISGESGLGKHIQDMYSLIDDSNNRKALEDEIKNIFSQLRELGLVTVKAKEHAIEFEGVPEIIILLAGYNPRSTKLSAILNDVQENPRKGNLRFYVSSFAGYGMHDGNMISLDEMKARLKAQE